MPLTKSARRASAPMSCPTVRASAGAKTSMATTMARPPGPRWAAMIRGRLDSGGDALSSPSQEVVQPLVFATLQQCRHQADTPLGALSGTREPARDGRQVEPLTGSRVVAGITEAGQVRRGVAAGTGPASLAQEDAVPGVASTAASSRARADSSEPRRSGQSKVNSPRPPGASTGVRHDRGPGAGRADSGRHR